MGSLLTGQTVVKGPFNKKHITLPDTGDVRVIAFPSDADAYQWSTPWQTPVIFVKDSGWVWVDVVVDGDTLRDSVYFKLPCGVYLQNVFSPNDEINDCLPITLTCEFAQFELIIYNRWGTIMAEISDPKACWDGTSKGQDLPEGVYYYTIKFAEKGKNAKTKTGFITLIR